MNGPYRQSNCLFLTYSILIAAFATVKPQALHAGILVAPHVGLGSISARAVDGEDTPNLYPYELGLNFGYSIGGAVDLGIAANHGFAKLSPRFTDSHEGSVTAVGAQIGFRVNGAIYLGFGAGQKILRLSSHPALEGFEGAWVGPYGEVLVGGIFPFAGRRAQALQFTMSMVLSPLSRQIADEVIVRHFDHVKLNLTYVYNSQNNKMTKFEKFVTNLFPSWGK
jgi:hypothetical protein